MFLAKPEKLPGMVKNGLLQLTRKKSVKEAWRTLISAKDVIGIKVFSAPGSNSGTRAAVVEAVIESLIGTGISPTNIIIWDRKYEDLRRGGFVSLGKKLGVQVASSSQGGWDEKAFYENSILGTPVWGDLDFGKKGDDIGRKSHVSRLLTKKITKIISVAPVLNHNLTGVTGHLYSLASGSVDNFIRFENNRERLSTAVPEIYALPEIYDRVVLNITDALICQYQGEQRTLLHYSAALDQLWFSKDAVALDVMAIHELDRQRKRADVPWPKVNQELYENASLLELGQSDPSKIALEKRD
jgi:hypothetical protein